MDVTKFSVDELLKQFNACISKLLKILELKSRKPEDIANLDRLRKRISLARNVGSGHELIQETAKYILDYFPQIMQRDEDFFNNIDLRAEFVKKKIPIGEKEELSINLMNSIRGHYNAAKQSEKDAVYAEVKLMTQCTAQYYILCSK